MSIAALQLLTPEHAEAFRALRLAALKECPTAFTADYETNARRTLGHFAAQIKTLPDNFLIGAFHHGALAGIGGFYRTLGSKLDHKGNIWSMFVAADLRRHGTGRRILAEILSRARAIPGIVQVHLSVISDNAPARALYEGAGFRSFGREPRALKVNGRFYDEDHMVLRL